ncbi:hypothetical protein HDU91_000347, partial [Kappamyces sp. JEL0680]
TNGTLALKSVLERFRVFYFTEYSPISQFVALHSLLEPAIPFLATPTDAVEALKSYYQEFSNIKLSYYHEFDTLARTVVTDTTDSIGYLIKDIELGGTLLSTAVLDQWQLVVLEGKLFQSFGGKNSAARLAMLNLFKVTPAWNSRQIDAWRRAIQDGWVMPQGGVERLLKKLQNIVDSRALFVEYTTAPGMETADVAAAASIVETLMASWNELVVFLEEEYLPSAIKHRPYANPGLSALGTRGLDLYDHLIERQVTIYNSPPETAQLGRELTAQLRKRMLKIAALHYGFTEFSQVAQLLVDRTSNISFFQGFNTAKVQEYLVQQSRIIQSVIHKEFDRLPVCDFDIVLFESVGAAFYTEGRVDHSKRPGEAGYCVEKGRYYAGVPTTDPAATFAYEKDDLSLLMHESIPGHHLQIESLLEAKDMAALMGDGLQSVLTESQSGMPEGIHMALTQAGMGLYANEPMRELRHYNNNMLRSLRLQLDSELHTGVLDREQATLLMMENGFSRAYAEEEVDRYCQNPGQALGYMRGRIVLDELRRTAVELFGISPPEFHFQALRFGTVSLKQLRQNMIDLYFASGQYSDGYSYAAGRRVSKAGLNQLEREQYASQWFPPQIAADLGGVSDADMVHFAENSEIKSRFDIQFGVAGGAHWTCVRAIRKADKKQVIIKKINRRKLPATEMYFVPCMSDTTCQCTRCNPSYTKRPPLELILLQSKDSSLPEFLEYVEDETHFYLVTKLHGVSERQFKRIWTWFGSHRFSRVYWSEFFS